MRPVYASGGCCLSRVVKCIDRVCGRQLMQSDIGRAHLIDIDHSVEANSVICAISDRGQRISSGHLQIFRLVCSLGFRCQHTVA